MGTAGGAKVTHESIAYSSQMLGGFKVDGSDLLSTATLRNPELMGSPISLKKMQLINKIQGKPIVEPMTANEEIAANFQSASPKKG